MIFSLIVMVRLVFDNPNRFREFFASQTLCSQMKAALKNFNSGRSNGLVTKVCKRNQSSVLVEVLRTNDMKVLNKCEQLFYQTIYFVKNFQLFFSPKTREGFLRFFKTEANVLTIPP